MGFCRMHMVYYNYWNSDRPAMLKICNFGILAVWKRNRVWNWYVFILGKSHMDCIFWLGNGAWKSDSWLYMVYYDSWNSVWKAVFQDGKTFFHAIWCQCDRVEYKNLRSHLRE